MSGDNGLLMVFLSNITLKLMKKTHIKSQVDVLKRTFLASAKNTFKRFLLIYIMDFTGIIYISDFKFNTQKQYM